VHVVEDGLRAADRELQRGEQRRPDPGAVRGAPRVEARRRQARAKRERREDQGAEDGRRDREAEHIVEPAPLPAATAASRLVRLVESGRLVFRPRRVVGRFRGCPQPLVFLDQQQDRAARRA
jgi:hypothetical protein